jgi:hypothetical protein
MGVLVGVTNALTMRPVGNTPAAAESGAPAPTSPAATTAAKTIRLALSQTTCGKNDESAFLWTAIAESSFTSGQNALRYCMLQS